MQIIILKSAQSGSLQPTCMHYIENTLLSIDDEKEGGSFKQIYKYGKKDIVCHLAENNYYCTPLH